MPDTSNLHANSPAAVEPEECFSEILNNFQTFDRSKSSPITTPRKIHSKSLSRTHKAKGLELSKTVPAGHHSHDQSKKSIRTKSTAVTDSLSTDVGDSPTSNETETTEETNKRLETENKRLKRLLRARERHSSKDGSTARTHKSESDIIKLTEKAKSFKHQFKDERRKSMRMTKHLEAHTVEIEGLQRELTKSLDTIDALEKDSTTDRAQLLKLTNELEEWRKKDAKTPAVKRLESELRQRNDELELTLEMLEAKVERIVLLENELRATKRRLHEVQQMEIGQTGSLQGSLSSLDLEESRAECRRLQRQNTMLKLLFEEINERRASADEAESIDSLLHRVALEIGGSASAPEAGGVPNGACTQDDFAKDSPGNPFSTPDCSPVRDYPSPDDDPSASEPSTDASSARAEKLFQREIERFSLQDSNSSFPKARRKLSPRSPQHFMEDTEWINPYDL